MKTNSGYKIAYRALSEGEHNIKMHVDSQMFTSVDDAEIHDGDCDVDITLSKSRSIIKLDLSIEGCVSVACDRCLEDVSVPIHYDGTLIVKITAETREMEFVIDDKEEDTLLLNPSVDTLDLEEYLYDSIILSLPLQRVHEEDENGVSGCNPDMLSRFTIADDDWDSEEDEDEEEDEDNNDKEDNDNL